MAIKKNYKSIYQYKPSNPSDPKIPFLKKADNNQQNLLVENSTLTNDNLENNIKNQKQIEKNNKEIFLADLEKEKQKALQIIARIKNQNSNNSQQKTEDVLNLKEEEKEEEKQKEKEQITSNVVMPNPNSNLSILNNLSQSSSIDLERLNETKKIIKTLRGEIRLKLTNNEIKKIIDTFKYKVVKIKTKEIILKNSKYGFEIYRNATDKKYWVATICFEELWNPLSVNYLNLWMGNAFMGYGYKSLDELIVKVNNLMTQGKTGNIMWRDFVTDWDKKKNRFHSGEKPKQFTYSEYKKIIKWYKENKIWILVKQAKVKDIEDLMEENKLKRKMGQAIHPMAKLQEKLLEPPRKVAFIYGYPVLNPNYKGKDYVNPENKLYEIGFALTE